MEAILVGTIKINDAALWAEYVAGLTVSLQPFPGATTLFRGTGGAVLVSTPSAADDAEADTVVAIRFTDRSELTAWYESELYQKLIPLRDSAADVTIRTYDKPQPAPLLLPAGSAAARRLGALAGHVSSSGSAAVTVSLPPAEFRDLVREPSPEFDDPTTGRWFCPVPAVGIYESPAELLTADAATLAAALREHGFVVLRQAVSASWVDECAAAFFPRLEAHIDRIGANDPETRNRGTHRHYIDIPMVQPFCAIAEVPLVGEIVHLLLGADAAAERLASDTPLGVGSTYQGLHADGGSGPFSETQAGELIRAPRVDNDVNDNLVVNWGLVDIDESNGPVEIAPRSHRYPPAVPTLVNIGVSA
jgi:uncharacterized protein (DUF1330 family)